MSRQEKIKMIDVAYKRLAELVNAHRKAHTQHGRTLRSVVLFGPLAEDYDYHEIDILEIVEGWPEGKEGAKLTDEFMRNVNCQLPGRLYPRIVNPKEALFLAERLHPIIQSVADGYKILFDSENFAQNLMDDVEEKLRINDLAFAKNYARSTTNARAIN
jgi:hypothetical protein